MAKACGKNRHDWPPLIIMELSMNTMKLKGIWNETASNLKQHFANLNDEDTNFPNGKEDEILRRLKGKIGSTKEKLRKLISKL
jgi:uncharacterized protein YjbJ (UPF0337 family)